MKEIVYVSLITGLYNEWKGTINIKVDESYEELRERIRINQINGTTIMQINSIGSTIKAVNINYITSIQVLEVKDEI